MEQKRIQCGNMWPDDNLADWPSNFVEFKELETILSCGICFEYMSTCMMTKCSHNFCSLCIRRYICYKQQCPICQESIFESDLHNNRAIDEIIEIFSVCRPKLLQAMKLVKYIPLKISIEQDSNFTSSKSNTTSSSDSTSTLNNNGTLTLTSCQELIDSSSLTSSKSSVISSSDPKLNETVPLKSSQALNNDVESLSSTEQEKIQKRNSESDIESASEKSSSIKLPTNDNAASVAAMDSDDSDDYSHASYYNKNYDENGDKMTWRKCQCLYCKEDEDYDDDAHGSYRYTGALSNSTSTWKSSTEPKSFEKTSFSSSTSASSGLVSTTADKATVVCPVCNVGVPSRTVNLHLDRCLANEKNKNNPPKPSFTKRKPLPKLVYTLLKEKELRKKLSLVGLPTFGNRQAMIKRHHEFTLIYNAECDSLNPKSAEEIVDEMTKTDELKSNSLKPVNKLQIDKNYSSSQVETAQKNYVQQHKSQFSELIEAARQSLKSEKPSSHDDHYSDSAKECKNSTYSLTEVNSPSQPAENSDNIKIMSSDNVKLTPSDSSDNIKITPSNPSVNIKIMPSDPLDNTKIMPSDPLDNTKMMPSDPADNIEMTLSDSSDKLKITLSNPLDIIKIMPSDPLDNIKIMSSDLSDESNKMTSSDGGGSVVGRSRRQSRRTRQQIAQSQDDPEKKPIGMEPVRPLLIRRSARMSKRKHSLEEQNSSAVDDDDVVKDDDKSDDDDDYNDHDDVEADDDYEVTSCFSNSKRKTAKRLNRQKR